MPAIAKTTLLAMIALATGASVAQAQSSDPPPPPSATEDEKRNIYIFQIENDLFNRFSPTDRDYTNGVRIGWLSPAITEMPAGVVALTTLPTFFGEAPTDSVIRRFGVSVGQNIYTPNDTNTSLPIYNDRPYAAWLYASFALQYTYKRHDPKTGTLEPVRLDTLQADVGLIGPAAGGEFVQNNVHRLIGVAQAYGWANQLHNEPTFNLAFERRWRTGRSVIIEDPKLEVDFIPRIAASLGNVAIYGDIGGTVRIGRTCATISGRPGRGLRCPVRRHSSAMAASAGICSPASTVRLWGATSSSTETPTVTACASRTGRSSARPRPASPSPIAACASPTPRCCARRSSSSRTASRSSARST